MHSTKRDKLERAYAQGYKAGVHGHGEESCRHFEDTTRGAWYGGWREGRDQMFMGDKFVIKIYHGQPKLD